MTYLKDEPIVVRFKGGVPDFILISRISFDVHCHALFNPCRADGSYQISVIQEILHLDSVLFTAGGMVLGPVVQYYAFGDFGQVFLSDGTYRQ